MSEYLLEVKDLCMRFGGLLAVDHVGFNVRPQEVFAIIGPNGAGKTTVFNCISGFYQPSSGSIALDGSAIEGAAATTWPTTAWCAPSRTCACSSP